MASKEKNMEALRAFFWPQTIAIVGASSDPRKPGGRVVQLLKEFSFPGEIIPINPGRREIQGLPCYPSLEEVKERVDLVVVSVPAAQVPGVVKQCAALGLKRLVIISGGFGELGREGRLLQDRLRQLVLEHDLTVLGPNCVGFINTLQPATPSFVLYVEGERLRSGSAAFIAQSGALGMLAVFLASREKMGFAYVISTGNEVDLDFASMISFLSREPRVKAIGGYLEGVNDGDALRRAFREAAAARKPVLILKAGSSSEAAEAIRSHTGAMAGSSEAYRAVFKEEGVLSASTLTELLSMFKAFQPGRLPQGNRVAVYSLSGGMGILTTELCPEYGLEMASFHPATVEQLQRLMPSIATVRNPLDATAAVALNLEDIRRSIELVLEDPGVDIFIFVTPFWRVFGTAASRMLVEVARHTEKPFLVIWPAATKEVKNELYENGVPLYDEIREAVFAAGALWEYARFQKHREVPDPVGPPPVPASVSASARNRLRECRGRLSEVAAKELLRLYGIDTPRGAVVQELREAVEAARQIGYPIVLKAVSPLLAHKTEAGAVFLEIKGDEELRRAWEQMEHNLREKVPDLVPEGFLVEEMVPGGSELVVGIRIDPVFGPLLMLGAGGILVELIKDISLRPAPVSPAQVLEMLGELKTGALWRGYRGRSGLDLDSLAEAVARFSVMGSDLREEVRELEINPLLPSPDGRAVAADALILLK